MSIYFKVPFDTETGKQMLIMYDRLLTLRNEIAEFVNSVGGIGFSAGINLMGLAGIKFESDPDADKWCYWDKKVPMYRPRRSKSNKELMDKFSSFDSIEREAFNKVIGFESFISTIGFVKPDGEDFFVISMSEDSPDYPSFVPHRDLQERFPSKA